ncbi:integral membrane protein AefA [Salmonella enterica subsp. enterica]|uniref:Integral membrane protein AefA n=1 Tax=Salmonella enterica I TaxID=59201 RepID=A0A447PQP2_SALET|nr:integral membrane protein AefA [Salmonella enterica subsp. enterica]
MLMQQNIKVKNWLDRALQSERNIKEQIAVLKGSLLLSRISYQQQQTLPSADETRRYDQPHCGFASGTV